MAQEYGGGDYCRLITCFRPGCSLFSQRSDWYRRNDDNQSAIMLVNNLLLMYQDKNLRRHSCLLSPNEVPSDEQNR